MRKIHCPECAHTMPFSEHKCPKCGEPMTADAIEAGKKRNRKLNIITAIIFAAIIAYFAWPDGDEKETTAPPAETVATATSTVKAKTKALTPTEAKSKFFRLYKELEEFKNEPEFLETSFGTAGKYNYWLVEMKGLHKTSTQRMLFEKYQLQTGDLMMLGMEYALGRKPKEIAYYEKRLAVQLGKAGYRQTPAQIVRRVQGQIEEAAFPVDHMLDKLKKKIQVADAGELAETDLVVYVQQVEEVCMRMAVTAGNVKVPEGLPTGVAIKLGEYLKEIQSAYAKRQAAMEALITMLTQNDYVAGRKFRGRLATSDLHMQAAHAALESAWEKARTGS